MSPVMINLTVLLLHWMQKNILQGGIWAEFIQRYISLVSASNSTGQWSTDGCHKDEKLSNDNATVCHCNHLTHFAVLMRVTDDKTVKNNEFPSYIL